MGPQVEQLLHSHPQREKISAYIMCGSYTDMKDVYNELKEEVSPLIHEQVTESKEQVRSYSNTTVGDVDTISENDALGFDKLSEVELSKKRKNLKILSVFDMDIKD